MEEGPKYPEVEVQLTGVDGNAFSILSNVKKGLKKNGASSDEVNQFYSEATSGDYDHLLQTCMKWVTVL